MPLIPEPPMPTKCSRWIFLNTSPLDQCQTSNRDRFAGVRTPQSTARGGHRGQAPAVFEQANDGSTQPVTAQNPILDHVRRARSNQGRRVPLLMAMRGMGIGEQDGGAPAGGDL